MGGLSLSGDQAHPLGAPQNPVRKTKVKLVSNPRATGFGRASSGPRCAPRFGVCPHFPTRCTRKEGTADPPRKNQGGTRPYSAPLVVRRYSVWGLSPFSPGLGSVPFPVTNVARTISRSTTGTGVPGRDVHTGETEARVLALGVHSSPGVAGLIGRIRLVGLMGLARPMRI